MNRYPIIALAFSRAKEKTIKTTTQGNISYLQKLLSKQFFPEKPGIIKQNEGFSNMPSLFNKLIQKGLELSTRRYKFIARKSIL